MILLVTGTYYSNKTKFIDCITDAYPNFFKYGSVKKYNEDLNYTMMNESSDLYLKEEHYDDVKFKEYSETMDILYMNTSLAQCRVNYASNEETTKERLDEQRLEFLKFKKFFDEVGVLSYVDESGIYIDDDRLQGKLNEDTLRYYLHAISFIHSTCYKFYLQMNDIERIKFTYPKNILDKHETSEEE